MHLAKFISENMEAILAEWETFAATLLPAAEDMDALALRDHAPQILHAVAKDITSQQTRKEQAEKSKGRAAHAVGAPETAAQAHAVLRARSGFDVKQLVAEYRALRASVLRLWLDTNPSGEPIVEEVIRFNEAIDQAVAESVDYFHTEMERARNLFLGMLGHDMRTPLNSIVATASFLGALNAGQQVSEAAEALIRSGASMRSLLDDLVDFNRTQLGLGIKVRPSDIDLSTEVASELEQLRNANPDRRIELAVTGDTRGHWDAARLNQVVRNLVSNAIEHGSAHTPVHVTLVSGEADVRLDVINSGSTIDPSASRELFDPLKKGLAPTGSHDDDTGFGLGLFIVREIVHAHSGKIEVHSEDGETAFTVHLPRQKRVALPDARLQ